MSFYIDSVSQNKEKLIELNQEAWAELLDKWVEELDKDLDFAEKKGETIVPIDIDIEWGGGGFAGYYITPAIHYFQKSERFNILHQFSVSAGNVWCNCLSQSKV